MGKATIFVISLILASFVITGFANYMAVIGDNYGVTDRNETQITTYNKLQSLAQKINESESKEKSVSILGGETATDNVWSNAKSGLDTTMGSFSIFSEMLSSATKQLNIGAGIGPLLQSAIVSIILIIVVMLGLSAWMRWDL